MCVYIYIYRERERGRDMPICIYIYIYITRAGSSRAVRITCGVCMCVSGNITYVNVIW